MSSSKPPFRLRDTVSLSGWIYADLLLGLMMLFLVSMRGATPDQLQPATHTPTPTATYTLTPTPTPSPTAMATVTPAKAGAGTRMPTPTLVPTFTPVPTATSTPKAYIVGLSQTPFAVTLRINPALISDVMVGRPQARATAQAQLRTQIRYCFARIRGQAGMVLAFGNNPAPSVGERLAELATGLLNQEYPDLFPQEEGRRTAIRNYHHITTDPKLNGVIDLDVFFITLPEYPDILKTYGEKCTPP